MYTVEDIKNKLEEINSTDSFFMVGITNDYDYFHFGKTTKPTKITINKDKDFSMIEDVSKHPICVLIGDEEKLVDNTIEIEILFFDNIESANEKYLSMIDSFIEDDKRSLSELNRIHVKRKESIEKGIERLVDLRNDFI